MGAPPLEDPCFFDNTPVVVGQELAVLRGGWEWSLTRIIEVDSEQRRLRCQGTTPRVSEKSFWYDRAGRVLSETTWRPLKRGNGQVDAWEAGRLYPLTDAIRTSMRLAAKHRQLQFILSHWVHWAIQRDWQGQLDEARLDFVLERFEQALEDLTRELGDNGEAHHYQRSLHLATP